MLKRKTSRNLSLMLLCSLVLTLLLPGTVFADPAPAQGGNQAAQLYDFATNAPHSDVTVLNTVDAGGYQNEGVEYFLNRVNTVYDISGGKDIKVQVKFSAGMNQYSDDVWENNAMRYMSVVKATTGEVVANWRNDGTLAGETNESGAYQIGYGADQGAANISGIVYYIPHKAVTWNTPYYVVIGSATCGNNNRRMLYAPIIYEITTSNGFGEGTVDDTYDGRPEAHDITLNVFKAKDDTESKVDFNRLESGGQSGGRYAVGEPITSAIMGWEIPIVVTPEGNRDFDIVIKDSRGNEVPINSFLGGGANASDFGDIRFTMPNDDVTIDVIFEGYGEDDDDVPVTGVSLNKDAAELEPNQTLTLVATVVPEDATNKAITWSSSDTEVATVDENGVVTAVGAGEAIITVTTVDGEFTDTCTVTVMEKGEVKPYYELTPIVDEVYTIGTTEDGIKTMTVNADFEGFKYFKVSVSPIIPHSGQEALVFVHLRDGVQQELNTVKADFDIAEAASAGFNVLEGDVIKVYIVDDLTNDEDRNPVMFQ